MEKRSHRRARSNPRETKDKVERRVVGAGYARRDADSPRRRDRACRTFVCRHAGPPKLGLPRQDAATPRLGLCAPSRGYAAMLGLLAMPPSPDSEAFSRFPETLTLAPPPPVEPVQVPQTRS